MSALSFFSSFLFLWVVIQCIKEEKDESIIEFLNNYLHAYFDKVFIWYFTKQHFIYVCVLLSMNKNYNFISWVWEITISEQRILMFIKSVYSLKECN